MLYRRQRHSDFHRNGIDGFTQVAEQVEGANGGSLSAQGTYAAGSFNLSSVIFSNQAQQSFTYAKMSHETWSGGYSGNDFFEVTGKGLVSFTEYGAGAWANGSLSLSSYCFDGSGGGAFDQLESGSAKLGSANTKSFAHLQRSSGTIRNYQEATYANGSYSFGSYSYTRTALETLMDSVDNEGGNFFSRETVQIGGMGQSSICTTSFSAEYYSGGSEYSIPASTQTSSVILQGRALPPLYPEGGSVPDIVRALEKAAGRVLGSQLPFPVLGRLGPLSIVTPLLRIDTTAGGGLVKLGPFYETGPWKWLKDNRDLARWHINLPYDKAWNRCIHSQKMLNPLAMTASQNWKSVSAGQDVDKNWVAWLSEAASFVAGLIDTITFGQSKKLFKLLLWHLGPLGDKIVDFVAAKLDGFLQRDSAAYRWGTYLGQVVNIVATVTPLGAAGRVLQAIGMVASAFNVADAVRDGDVGRAVQSGLAFIMIALRRVTNCKLPASLQGGVRTVAQIGITGIRVAGIGADLKSANNRFENGDIIGGLLDIGQAGADMFAASRACFTAEMLLDAAEGKKRADAIKVGDFLWSRSEYDPYGPIELKEVEEVFTRVSPILNVHVAGQIIRTTPEHPFRVFLKGWVPAAMLEIGDLLMTRGGLLVPVEGVADSGQVETVYNWRIAEHHTYFVSATEDAASIWAHNTYFRPTGSAQSIRNRGGRFADLDNSRLPGQVGHHVPQNAYMRTIGVSRADGPAIGMTTRDHARTRTYAGRGAGTMRSDAGLTPRQRLAQEIRDIRRLFGRRYNRGALEAIEYAETLPQFQRPPPSPG